MKITSIEQLQEGDVLTWGDWQHPLMRVTDMGWYVFANLDPLSDRKVSDLIRWGAIERPEPEEITEVAKVQGSTKYKWLYVPAEFRDETELEVTFKKVKS